MIAYYVVTREALPPSSEGLVNTLRHGEWHQTVCEATPLMWDDLSLVHASCEARVFFTLGPALPREVLSWTPWAGRALDADGLALLEAAGATFRIEVPAPTASAASADARTGARYAAAVAAAVARAVNGILLDVKAQRFWPVGDVERLELPSFDVRDYISVHADQSDQGFDLHTHGLVRFGCPEVAMFEVPELMLTFGMHTLNEVAQHQALGHPVRDGQTVQIDGEYTFGVCKTAKMRDHVVNEVLMLTDPTNTPHDGPRQTLARFAEDVSDDLEASGDAVAARNWLTLALQLDPSRTSAAAKLDSL